MSAYRDLDEAIVAYIATQRGHPIYSRPLLDLAAGELGTTYKGGDKEWRLIERRMSLLKRRGRIVYLRPSARWAVVIEAAK